METTLPSGYEVESATFHPPQQPGLRGKLDGLRTRGVSKVHDLQRSVGGRFEVVKRSMSSRAVSLRDGAKTEIGHGVSSMQSSMRTNPMKWAGIAAATGFGLGMIGRLSQTRAKQRMRMPDLVIIESTC